MAAKKKPKVSFESGMAMLEEKIQQMQRGEAPLDDMMRMYEEGMALVAQLEETLAAHRKRIEQIDPETAEITPFEEDEHGVS